MAQSASDVTCGSYFRPHAMSVKSCHNREIFWRILSQKEKPINIFIDKVLGNL
jgi:hypothetical protein